jgi:hypothetical protein
MGLHKEKYPNKSEPFFYENKNRGGFGSGFETNVELTWN